MDNVTSYNVKLKNCSGDVTAANLCFSGYNLFNMIYFSLDSPAV